MSEDSPHKGIGNAANLYRFRMLTGKRPGRAYRWITVEAHTLIAAEGVGG